MNKKQEEMNEVHNITTVDDLIRYKKKKLNEHNNGCICDIYHKLALSPSSIYLISIYAQH